MKPALVDTDTLSMFFRGDPRTILEFARRSAVLPITEHSANISADLYARLRREGQPLDDIDLLIAGVALANGLALVTHNTDHFGRIEELEVQDWSR